MHKKTMIIAAIAATALMVHVGAAATATSVPAGYVTAVTATVQSDTSIMAATVDLAALLGAETSSLASAEQCPVLVRPMLSGHPGNPLRARLDLAAGLHRVTWEVPAATKEVPSGSAMSFEVTFNPANASPSPPLPAEVEVNLVADGNPSILPLDRLPFGVSQADLDTRFRVVEEDGSKALAFNADPEGRGPVFRTNWLAVLPGHAYEFGFRYRIDNGTPHPRYNLLLYSYVNFRSESGETIPRTSLFRTFTQSTDGWERCASTITIPEGASSANLEIRNGSTEPYSVLFTDVRVAPISPIRITELRSPEGERISSRIQGDHIRRFDLGPAKSPVWEGFTPLTPEMSYTPEQTYGFTRLDRPKAPDRTRPDDLARDFIASPRAELQVDLPNGDYTVRVLCGDSQVGSVVYWLYFNRRFSINRALLLEDNQPPAEFFRSRYLQHYDSFWRPDLDYYDTFVASRFETHSFPATVNNGSLRLEWRNLPVAAIMIAPQEMETGVDREWQFLARARRHATPVDVLPSPVSPAQEERTEWAQGDMVLFRRPANETVYPESRPTADDVVTELSLFAAPGQSESTHVSVLPLRDLGAVSVRSSAWRSTEHEIAPDAITIRVARYIFKQAKRTRHLQPGYHYQVAPFPLDERNPVPAVTAGVTWTWWATVRVPEQTPPGIYRGTLTIEPETGRTVNLPVRLRVLPFTLASLPIVQGYYYSPSEPWYSTFWRANVMGANYRNDPDIRALIAENERRELAFMQSLGLNSAAFGDDLRGDLDYTDGTVRLKDDDRFTFWMDIYAAAGMGPMPFYGFQPIGGGNNLSWLNRELLNEQFTETWNQAYRSLVQYVQGVATQRGWPEILWYVTDEKSNYGEAGAIMGKRLAQALEDLDGVTVIASMNGPWEHIMVPHLDISMPNIAFPITAETVAMIRDAGSKLWLYNCGDERITLGLYPWRLEAGGRFQWHYRSMVADPWDDLDGTYGESAYSISLPGPSGPVPTLDAETVRAAINDHRYAVTLERTLATARGNPAKRDAVARAETFLDDLRERIPVDVRTLIGFRVDPRAAGAAVGGEFKNVEALERMRWAMAQHIIDLQEEN